MAGESRRYRSRHIAALDLIEAWTLDNDADVANLAGDLARDPQAACYALARIVDVALQTWADAVDIDQAEAFAILRAKIERDLPHGGR